MTAKIDLNGQLAELYRLSPNNSRISKHITQAKTALGITAPKKLSEPEKVAVYQYHVNINSQDAIANVETFSQNRIAFYTTDNGTRKRQVIALDGFYVNALILVAGIDKKGVTAWIQGAVDGFTGFDCNEGITRQVKYLVVRELVNRLKNSKV